MTENMRNALRETLRMWSTLDDYHKGREYEKARENLEKWLKEEPEEDRK